MGVNTFDQNHLESISKVVSAVNPAFLVKRSAHFTKAVVIGRPDQPGAVILSLVDDYQGDGRSAWLSQAFANHTPKEVADGHVDLASSWSDVDWYWADMLKTVKAHVTSMS